MKMEKNYKNHIFQRSISNFVNNLTESYVIIIINNKCLMKFQRKYLLMHTSFLSMMSISLFHCCKKILSRMNTWMIGKNLMKHCYQRKKISTVTEICKTLMI